MSRRMRELNLSYLGGRAAGAENALAEARAHRDLASLIETLQRQAAFAWANVSQAHAEHEAEIARARR